MPDPKVHFLNVRDGDCFIIERSSGRVTVIDICCGNLDTKTIEEAKYYRRPIGDYGMRERPTNPVDYLINKQISEIWRFLLTHPDMDHMDGIKALFSSKNILHFWDCGIRKKKPEFDEKSPYQEADWDFYEDLISSKVNGTSIVTPRAGSRGKYWNADDDNKTGEGDYLSIVAPTEDLVKSANEGGDINDASYVIVYRSSAGRIIFMC